MTKFICWVFGCRPHTPTEYELLEATSFCLRCRRLFMTDRKRSYVTAADVEQVVRYFTWPIPLRHRHAGLRSLLNEMIEQKVIHAEDECCECGATVELKPVCEDCRTTLSNDLRELIDEAKAIRENRATVRVSPCARCGDLAFVDEVTHCVNGHDLYTAAQSREHTRRCKVASAS